MKQREKMKQQHGMLYEILNNLNADNVITNKLQDNLEPGQITQSSYSTYYYNSFLILL